MGTGYFPGISLPHRPAELIASSVFKHLESLLYDYPDLEDEINRRRMELMYPLRDEEENIGASKTQNNNSMQEHYIIALEQDKRLRVIEEQRIQIKNALFKLSKEERRVIEMRYFSRPQTLTWEGVALKTGYSVRQCYNIRNKLVNAYGKCLGFL